MAAQLPNEILLNIFELLCFHCTNPGKFPNADTEGVLEDKATLARLCRVSHHFRSMAQPILYHYYATGNCKHFLPPDAPYYDVPGANDRLLSFTTTLTQRPDLAAEVVSMQLINHPGGYREYRQNENVMALQALLRWSESHRALSVSMLELPFDKWCTNTSQLADWAVSAHRWVMSLAMVLAVKVKDVLIAVDDEEDQDQTRQAFPELNHAPRPQIRSLKTLGMMSWGANPYQLARMSGLLGAAPNLETIYAVDTSDSRRWNQASLWDYKTDTPMPKIKTVVISDLCPRSLDRFLTGTPGLEELEYYWTVFPQQSTELYMHLLPAKATLKRLVVSFLSSCDRDSLPWFRYDFVDPNVRRIQSLADFPLLEDVTIDFRTLYREGGKDEANRLTRFLPAGIRRFAIDYVVGDMTESLRELAGAAAHMFPKLESVAVGVPEWPNGNPKIDADMWSMMKLLFQGLGIRFSWGEDAPGPGVHTVIPGASGQGLPLLPWYGKEEGEADEVEEVDDNEEMEEMDHEADEAM
ncbi:hypothetical protein PG996_000370 [Apiospora saccharicola]|uniref:F-box domain-containing protein n=1 Tax=Apiospora saccharicola TaxID=335842 RepID=A0ABR1WHE0_9PEZI